MVNEDKIPEEVDIVFRVKKEFIGRCKIAGSFLNLPKQITKRGKRGTKGTRDR
jgi:hypothetical protein